LKVYKQKMLKIESVSVKNKIIYFTLIYYWIIQTYKCVISVRISLYSTLYIYQNLISLLIIFFTWILLIFGLNSKILHSNSLPNNPKIYQPNGFKFLNNSKQSILLQLYLQKNVVKGIPFHLFRW
jgi:Mn2+/Fe2+ NRAMP family transporter